MQNFAIALLLRAFHALNQNILTDNLFDPDLIRGSLTGANQLKQRFLNGTIEFAINEVR